jgi:hypothetical protein
MDELRSCSVGHKPCHGECDDCRPFQAEAHTKRSCACWSTARWRTQSGRLSGRPSDCCVGRALHLRMCLQDLSQATHNRLIVFSGLPPPHSQGLPRPLQRRCLDSCSPGAWRVASRHCRTGPVGAGVRPWHSRRMTGSHQRPQLHQPLARPLLVTPSLLRPPAQLAQQQTRP